MRTSLTYKAIMTIANNTVVAKIFAALAVAGLVVSSVAAFAPTAGAQTTTTTTTTTSASVSFSRDLTIGSTGADVTALQNWLISKGHTIAAGATGYFGAQTQAALAAYQAANGISPAAGYFGPITRAKVAMGGSTGGTGTGTGTGSTGDLSGGEANLTDFDLRAEDSSGNEGEEGVELATAEFDVEDADVRIERAELTFDAASSTLEDRPWQYFDTIYVMVDGDEVADIDASDKDEWDETSTDIYTISFTGLDVVVDEDDMASLTFVADIADSIDADDLAGQSFSFYVDTDGIRAVDAEGIQQYIGKPADKVTGFDFDAEDNGDLKISTSDEDPDSAILVGDADDESEEYLAFAFDMENKGDADSLVTDITVDVATGTAALTAMVRDIILVVDGDEFDGDIDNDTGLVTFENIDVEIAADDELAFEVMVTLKSNPTPGTIDFSLANADVDAEGVDSGDTTTVTGSANGNTHTVALTGIAVEAVSTSESVTTPGDTASNTYATYTIKFDVTALEEDAYINDLAASTSAAANGAEFVIIGDAYAGPAASVSLTSTADLESNYFRVREGDTETFTLTVTLNPTTAGTFGIRLSEVNFNEDAADGDVVFTVDANSSDFRTDNVYITN